MLPRALSRLEGVLYPVLFALETALPIVALLGLLSFGAMGRQRHGRTMARTQRIVSVAAGLLVVLVGLNDTIAYWLL